ncbi:1-(5-phosphoribosyl)-5-[(5-phosphoribosylamino)methylideneamino]imidazole-4-carboxamide isomerase [Hanamia caeni]|jgi:phosphoribosylformimino-5-aminoimidazole carboxamide ribotide isomerase|uniref:1-(5-phosphoribosyl)-5-[(5-phosphoribosylamino)methylideneamino] imidazole-4-carboxamide isomerase n=1 Tax=Hanamia caeni TaxID=2294116 RepID=A0A3M9N6D1_9BACT|nr:1-(5-phosphoribosyl)-5-[(5-phosphoribosylamino)methylideneamino]imidazole-4-carboxamide isomerase [Hanamia caeni]RNI32763.1 1-(5-phosphoribosyl)-5-[(5-phosphoribosylamino)methylideneamino]imidazole-4-carboxamide isomerase [Hanamia caeni]
MEIIPAIDLIGGKCVRLSKGDFDQKIIYSDAPLEVAKSFEAAGIKRLHIVDLDGARGKTLSNVKVLETIAKNTSLIIDFGGGIKKTEDLRRVFDGGASMVSVGSVTVKDPGMFENWICEFGAEKFLPGADVLNKNIKIHGWKEDTGIDIFSFIEALMEKEISQVFCTDISKDGMLQGPATALYKEILLRFPSLKLIASGGISSFYDLVILKEAGCSGAIVGKAIYENKISLKQLENFIKN